jgi:hypothetical protein
MIKRRSLRSCSLRPPTDGKRTERCAFRSAIGMAAAWHTLQARSKCRQEACADLFEDAFFVQLDEEVGRVGARHAEENVATRMDGEEFGHIVNTCTAPRRTTPHRAAPHRTPPYPPRAPHAPHAPHADSVRKLSCSVLHSHRGRVDALRAHHRRQQSSSRPWPRAPRRHPRYTHCPPSCTNLRALR